MAESEPVGMKDAFHVVEMPGKVRYHEGNSNMKGAADEGEDRP
jgi:hypothetical protein